MSGESSVDTDQAAEQRSAAASYVYGIVLAGTRLPDDLVAIPNGDDDGELGVVTHERLAAVVSNVPVDRRLGSRRDLMAHERVLNTIAEEATVLPMRFGGVVTDDDAVADELLATHHDYFVWALEQMEGKAQFVLRGDYDQEMVLRRLLEENSNIQDMREKIQGVDPDASYYDRIALGEAIANAMSRLREVDSAAAQDALGRYAVAMSVHEASGENGAVHIAFLVERTHRSDFERAVDDIGDAWAGRVNLRLVGPVAPFDFLPEAEEMN